MILQFIRTGRLSQFSTPPLISLDSPFKGIVQQDVTGVEMRLEQPVLINYVNRRISFLYLKDRHHKRSIQPVSAT